MGFGNFGNIMSGPSYLDQRRYIDERAGQIGSSVGKIAGGLSTIFDREKAQKIRDDYEKSRSMKHAADNFQFDEDAYRQQFMADQQPQATEISAGEWDAAQDQSYMNDRDGQMTDLDAELRAMSGEPMAPEVEQPAPMRELTPEDIEAEKARQRAALFGEDMDETEYERLRQMYKPDMTRAQEDYRLAQLLRPYDPKGADELEERAYNQHQFDEKMQLQKDQLLDANTRADAKALNEEPFKKLVRAENYISGRQTAIQQLMQRRGTVKPNNTTALNSIDSAINKLTSEINNAQKETAAISEGSDLANLYAFQGAEGGPTNAPASMEQPTAQPVNMTGDALQDNKSIDEALRAGTIDQDTASRLKEDVKFTSKEQARKTAPKRNAGTAWNSLVKSNSYKKERAELREWQGFRNQLSSMLDKDLTQAQRGQLGFQIARVVTGPGVLTESDINSTKGQTRIDGILGSLGLSGFVRGTDYEQDKVKESINAALANTAVGETKVAILNDLIKTEYNDLHKGFEKPYLNINEFMGGNKKTTTTPKRRKATSADLERLFGKQ